MKLLVIDTATEACSVALEVDGKVYSQFEICPQQHSQRILPMVDEVLKQAEIELSDLDYLGYGRGPGSFTGVRIATGIIQGLALGADLPVVGVSTLAAMAQQALQQSTEQQKHCAVAIDARMAEVYFAVYTQQNGVVSVQGQEAVLPPEQAAMRLPEADNIAIAGTGWQAYSEVLNLDRANSDPTVVYPDAKYMLALAKDAIAKNQATAVEDIQPVYLRDKVTWKKLPGRE